MKAFASLIQRLESTNKTTLRTEAIFQFLDTADEKDKLWFLALFTGKRPKRKVSTTLLKQWAIEMAQIPEWLFVESYSAVGDLGETISLILPEGSTDVEKTLDEWMQAILHLKDVSEEEKKEFVTRSWKELPHLERFIFNKLLGGSFRVGVSDKGLINALAQYYDLEASAVAHSIMGEWSIDQVSFEEFIKGAYADTQLSKPYPFCLAYPVDKGVEDLGLITAWQAEYKWDGIRGQIIKRKGEIFIWSRGEELVTSHFPEIISMFHSFEDDFVIDGEILAFKEGSILNFSELQKRLNRKNINKKILEEVPVTLFLYDILELNGEDIRALSLAQRRVFLEELISKQHESNLQLSPIITAEDWSELKTLRAQARELNSEGLMLKHKDSTYHTGRKKGDWWKWKIDPLTIDAVLIYAQKGSGRRSGYYTDYTFAVRKGDELVTITKAYSGLTEKEIQEVSKFVNKNATEKFGPVRTVKPELVFEIAFEGIGYSSRHKSGVALRFPRIVRWRRDKTVADIDDIEQVKALIK